ncbi:MAG: hypothetical protein ACLQU4_10010 [Limisphaerales bacterium]
MKKLIIAYAALAALLSLPACSSTNGTSAASTTSRTNAPVSQVPFPDNPGTRNLPTATPDLPHPVPGPN